jgi:hypothetical protein
MTWEEYRERVAFQRELIGMMRLDRDDPRTGPQTVNMHDRVTGRPLTNKDVFELHSRLFMLLLKHEPPPGYLTTHALPEGV